ncbi:DUF2264 domain-containing protein [Kribbella ginsengisoli]|uniref:DUF2264 domain-containing protein n=1 Tax=Kribbella ginsengisoli TaxID=363865 RepID=A0ABP6W8I2_9ACTN
MELSLPPEDRRLSPRTGWTRAHWEAAADSLLTATARYAGPGHALISLPVGRPGQAGPRADGLEGFARTFLLAAFRVAGAGGDDPGGLLAGYASGLVAGTARPTTDRELSSADPVSWPIMTDHGQALVEAASIAVGLRLTRPWLWDRLDPAAQQRIADWLEGGLHVDHVDNNWWLFPAMVGAFLSEVGADPRLAGKRAVSRGLARIEQWYRGDGWYTDGRPRAFDHYVGWAFHLYPALHAHLSGDQGLLDLYGERLSAFLTGYARMFGSDGAPLHQGRSLCYRFAATAPLWMGALTGHTPLPVGQTRRLASGALRHFLDHGAADPDGLLSLGWHHPWPPMIQSYSGPASPYWASKGFVGLLLPADHPEWTATERPAPVEEQDAVHPLGRPGWLIQSTAADGIVRMHNHGSDNQPGNQLIADDPMYARLAYSTGTGPVFDQDPDNHFGLVVSGVLTERGPIHPLGTGPGWAASAHRPRAGATDLSEVTITSVVFAHGADEVHVHLVSGAPSDTTVRHSGWAVTERGPLSSVLLSLAGFDSATTRTIVGGTAFGSHARMPVLSGRTRSEHTVFACQARLSGSAEPTRDVQLTLDADKVVVSIADARFEATLTTAAIHVTRHT